jgi:DNA-binding CsgD family transcriptional regulator
VQTLRGLRPKPPDLGAATSDQPLTRTLVKPIIWTMVLDGTYDESVKGRVEVVVKHLQQLLGDSSLTVQVIQQGSIIVRFKGSEAGFKLMKALFESGKVTQLDGLELLQVFSADDFELANMPSDKLIATAARVLTARQREVLQLLAEGHTMQEVAATLHVATRTVAFHKYRIMQDFGLETNSDLLRFAIKQKVVQH